jgi:hypothetical protein
MNVDFLLIETQLRTRFSNDASRMKATFRVRLVRQSPTTEIATNARYQRWHRKQSANSLDAWCHAPGQLL